MTFDFSVWRTAIAGLIFQALGLGVIGVYGFYIEPVGRYFDQGHATLNLGLALLMVLGALVSPLLGRVIDRSSLKPVIAFGAILAALGLCVVSMASSFQIAVAGYLLFAVGIVLYGPLVCNLLIVRSYQQNRARALAIAAIGVSVASVLLPLLVAWLMTEVEWQRSLQVLALVIVVGVFGSALLLVVEPPRRSLMVDDTPAEKGDDTRLTANSGSAIRYWAQLNFWLLGFVVSICMSVMALLALIMVPHFLSTGLSVEHAAWLVSSTGVSGMLGKTSLAVLSERIGPWLKSLAVFLACLQLCAWLILLNFTGPSQMLIAMLALGFTNGLFIPLLPYICSVYFDESSLGKINGAHMAMMLPFALLGPWLAGRHFDEAGSYAGVFAALCAVLACVIAALLALRKPS
ncbi:MAG: MFS transporter [Pseudomonadales bacterium]